ncbi:MAG TPA: mechanosensitive ion channel domain-containing protein [Solirubrobacteraceae bacterium]|nr:mechanosensitive ion channel domain-containing protein [Solirubrobacteraceae bacterium]
MAADLASSFLDDVNSFLDDNSAWITAVVSVVLAVVLATLLDRMLAHRGQRMASAVIRGELSAATDTRLRFIRRLIYAAIIVLGVAVALAQFDGINRLAASLLASGAIAAAILGFAARQTLANFVAGIMLAVTQPIRVGDWVYVEEEYGVVDDIRLTYTFLRSPDGQHIVVPNEKLASGILRNDTLGEGAIRLDVQIWIPAAADAGRAVRALEEETGQSVSVAETTVDGVRLTVGGEPCPPSARGPREAALRLQCLERLRTEGLLATVE